MISSEGIQLKGKREEKMSLFKEKKSFFGRLSEKISDVIMARGTVDEELMDELEEVLILTFLSSSIHSLSNKVIA